jgi:Tol biopolymer transport system component
MRFSPGTRFGPYDIVAPLGAGGMGEVYRARDTKLDRDVALKILPDSFGHDPDRVTRFEREAKTLAALNHAHIAQIYGLEQSSAGSALVMELVDGEDLAARIARAPIPMDEALPIARQLAEAIETAHESGIIHRDLKPANIKVRADGIVKVLDFGLAKLAAADSTGTAGTFDATAAVTSPAMTMQGVILGTAAYMSPEQAKAKPIDRRADIWAFGCVLFEMLTGRRAFEGEDVTDTIAAVVSKEPDWSQLPASTPPSVQLLLRRCLEKNPNRRLPHIGVARLELDGAPAMTAAGPLPSRRAGAGRWMLAAVPILLAIGLGAGWWGASRLTSTAPAPAYRASLIFAGDARLSQVAPTARFAVSPDGTQLAFVGTNGGANRLWLRPLNGQTARPLADIGGASGGAPFWSPDGNRVAFFSSGQLMRVDVAGGPPTVIAESPAFRQQPTPGTWSADGVIVVSRGGTLARVPATGGALQPLTTLDTAAGESFHAYPHFLPDGQHLLYTAYTALTPVGVYAIPLDRPSERQKIMDGGSNVQYADGALLYVRDNTVVAQPFDPARRTLSGEPAVIVDSVLINIAIHFGGAFSASRTGALVHQGASGEQGLDTSSASRTLAWRTPAGAAQTLIDEPGTYRHLAIAPDGRHALVTKMDARGRTDLWTIDLARGVRTRVSLTHEASQLSGAVWSADGTAFVVNLPKGQSADLYRKPNDSTSAEELLLADARPKMPMSFSPDGRFLLYDTVNTETGGDIWVLPLEAPAKAAPFVSGPYFERFAQFSPDGKWVAFASDESGATEIYARAFPGGQTQVRVSASGGDVPRWSRDGRQLFFYSNGKMMAANVKTTAASLEVASVVPLFDCRPPEGFRRMFYDVMPDGRFLMMTPTADALPMSLTLTVNWPQLRRGSR